MSGLFHTDLYHTALRTPLADALVYQGDTLSYQRLWQEVEHCATRLRRMGVGRGDRVAIYLEKRFETVIAMFAASVADAVFVPVNPQLKAAQVAYILEDCSVKVLVTSQDRWKALESAADRCPALESLILVDTRDDNAIAAPRAQVWASSGEAAVSDTTPSRAPVNACIDSDVAAILYTSGSTGQPKGVVLSHRNIVLGAESVSSYLENSAADRILCVLPLSFDYGMSQITTAFRVGACAVLINHLFARDIVRAVVAERITGFGAVPALWSQLARLDWREAVTLRYLTNSGGAMPAATLSTLRSALPGVRFFLMYGLTEAFRSTYLSPELLDERPGSIGKAIPHAEILVVRPDGSLCEPMEHGELVHRGGLVALGYWNDPDKTRERFKPLPNQCPALTLTETVVWSGDTVYRDQDGFLYYVGRADEMIKVSGYRISPTEIEDVLYGIDGVLEAAVFGIPDPELGQGIIAIVHPAPGATVDEEAVRAACLERLPRYMLPGQIAFHAEALPRNPNGKIDRKGLRAHYTSH